jgi:hypothetical protein
MSRSAESKPRAKSAKQVLKESIEFNHPPATTPATPDNIVEAKLINNLQIFLKAGRLAGLFGLSANVQFDEEGIILILAVTLIRTSKSESTSHSLRSLTTTAPRMLLSC